MLKLNGLIIIYILLSSGFLIASKNKNLQLRKIYITINCLMALWEMIPFFFPIHHPLLNTLFNWSPLLFLPLLHQETALTTTALREHTFDKQLLAFEAKYFSSIMNFHHKNHMSYTLVSEYLHMCYLSFFVLIYGIPLYFYLRQDIASFHESMFAILFVIFSCFFTHALIPVHGPRMIYKKINDHRSHGFFFRFTHKVLTEGSTAGTAFPSGHTAVACMALLITWHLQTPLFYFIVPMSLGLIISTVYGRFHYVIDVMFGAMYAIITFFITQFIFGIHPT